MDRTYLVISHFDLFSWLIEAQACRLLRDVAARGDPTGGHAEEAPLAPRGKRNAKSRNQPPRYR